MLVLLCPKYHGYVSCILATRDHSHDSLRPKLANWRDRTRQHQKYGLFFLGIEIQPGGGELWRVDCIAS